MHSAGLELTKLTYTRLEDNLIRHRGDRLMLYVCMAHKAERGMGGVGKPLLKKSRGKQGGVHKLHETEILLYAVVTHCKYSKRGDL